MEKILLVIFTFLCFGLSAFADVMPSRSSSIGYYGIGLLKLPNSFTLYSKPDTKSAVIEKINLNQTHSAIVVENNPLKDLLIARSDSLKLALATVETDSEDGWFEITINQKTGKTGWIKRPDLSEFLTWKNFFYIYGKKYGVYMFRDAPKAIKTLRSQDSATSQPLQTITYAKYIIFSIIRGNWMMVNVLDVGNKSKIGWMRWRSPEGKIYLFPRLSGH